MKKEIIYCDRCGEDIEKNKTKGEAIGLYLYRYDADVQGYESQYDLCDKCLAELKEWFGNKEEEAEKKVEEAIDKIETYEKQKEYQNEEQQKCEKAKGYGNCSVINDICPYDINCIECEVHHSVERAKEEVKVLNGEIRNE